MNKTTTLITKLAQKIAIPSGKSLTFLTDTLNNSEITLNKNSSLTLISIISKPSQINSEININLNGENSSILFLGIINGKKSSNFDIKITATHKEKHTKADISIRSILNDTSKINLTGNLKILAGAISSESHLSHHTLILSQHAHAETYPCLQISEDKVKAGHSASISELDENQIFYLASRNIDKKTSEKILTKSFLQSDLDKIKEKKYLNLINNLLSS